jgi:hypothetical protein
MMRVGDHAVDKNGIEAVLIGAVCLMIALVAGAGADSSAARFFTGVLGGGLGDLPCRPARYRRGPS